MKRSTPLARKTPMKRSPFKNTADRATSLRRSAMKARVKKPTVAEGSKYLAACRGEPCFLRVPGICPLNPNDETVVPCHENSLSAGKGMGIKARHDHTVPGCFRCHHWLDQGPVGQERKKLIYSNAMAAWAPVRARKMGLKEEEGEVLDSNTDGHAVAHAARTQREAVCDGSVSAHGGAGDDGLQAGAAEGARRNPAFCLG